MSGTGEAGQGEPPRVFNCSSVGYPAMLAAVVVGQDQSFLGFTVSAEFQFSGFGAQYPG